MGGELCKGWLADHASEFECAAPALMPRPAPIHQSTMLAYCLGQRSILRGQCHGSGLQHGPLSQRKPRHRRLSLLALCLRRNCTFPHKNLALFLLCFCARHVPIVVRTATEAMDCAASGRLCSANVRGTQWAPHRARRMLTQRPAGALHSLAPGNSL